MPTNARLPVRCLFFSFGGCISCGGRDSTQLGAGVGGRIFQEAQRSSEERIQQLEHDLRIARSQPSGGCNCTIS